MPSIIGATDLVKAEMCLEVYEGICARYLKPNGAVSFEDNETVTSEGTDYVGSLAVTFRDKERFDLVEDFAMNTLERKNWVEGSSTQQWRANGAHDPTIYGDRLMGWNYSISLGQVNDWNWATDADIGRIRNLIWASKVFGDDTYLARALDIAEDLKAYGFVPTPSGFVLVTDEFQQQVTLSDGTPESFTVLSPGHHEYEGKWYAEFNPSYADMAAMRLLHDNTLDQFWRDAEAGTLAAFEECMSPTGSLPTSAGLAPNWCAINEDGEASAITDGVNGWENTRETIHAYEAFRLHYRLAWVERWYERQVYRDLLTPVANHFVAEWTANGQIAAEQDHQGNPLSDGYEKPMMTAGAVLAIEAALGSSNATAAAIRSAKLDINALYDDDDGNGNAFWWEWPGTPNYFTDCWLTFYFLQESGLWDNYGQLELPEGYVGIEFQDFGEAGDSVIIERQSWTPPPPPPPDIEPCERWLFIGHDDRIIDVSDIANGLEWMAEIEGRGAIPVRRSTIIVPGEPGVITTDIQHDARTMAFPLHARGQRGIQESTGGNGDPEILLDVLRDFIRSLDPVGDESGPNAGIVILRLIKRNREFWDLRCRILDGLGINQETHHMGFERLGLVVEADDPYWYGMPRSHPFFADVPRSWFPMIREDEPWLSASILGVSEINIDGDVKTWPSYTVVGPSSTIRITNIDNPEEIIVLDPPSLLAGEQITIDTATGEVTGPNGENYFRYLEPGSRTMFPLRKGVNRLTLELEDSSAGAWIAVNWQQKRIVP